MYIGKVTRLLLCQRYISCKALRLADIYIGSTNNLSRRLSEHNMRQTRSLLHQRPLEVVFQKEYGNMLEARRIEVKLKKCKSRSIIAQIVKDKEIKMGP